MDDDLFLRNVADTLKRYRNHPVHCPLVSRATKGVPPDPLNQGIDRLVRELDGTRYYQPNSRLVNLRNSGPWSNLPLREVFPRAEPGLQHRVGRQLDSVSRSDAHHAWRRGRPLAARRCLGLP